MPQMLAEVDKRGSLSLPDGRDIEYEIRFSTRARSARLRVGARDGLVVVVPAGLRRETIQQIVSSRGDWIAARLADFDAVRHLVAQTVAVLPQAFDLAALAESWRIEYREMKRSSVGAKTDRPGRIVVFGTVEDVAACHAALRRWLARRAAETLPPWLERVAAQCGPTPSDISIKNQRTRCFYRATWCAMSWSMNCVICWNPTTPTDSGHTCARWIWRQMLTMGRCAMHGRWFLLGRSAGQGSCFEPSSYSTQNRQYDRNAR